MPSTLSCHFSLLRQAFRLVRRERRCAALLCAAVPALILAGCGSTPPAPSPADSPVASSTPAGVPKLPRAGSGRGGYYLDDGPGDHPPANLLDTPDAEPRVEPYFERNNRPYVAFGKRYVPITGDQPFRQRGIGSWYGKKFHGKKTASGELYDMYKMSAAHPTLPLPSYARVTNLRNGKQVIVRVNDRGPFLSNRIIDLSYTAALKLGYLEAGSGELEVERLLPADIARLNAERRTQLARQEQGLPTPQVVAEAAAASGSTGGVSGAAGAVGGDLTVAPDLPPQAPQVITTAPASNLAPGFYLQMGAYTQEANARAAGERLAQQGLPSLPGLTVVDAGVYFRLYSGPFGTRAEAAAAAMRLESAGAERPLIVQR